MKRQKQETFQPAGTEPGSQYQVPMVHGFPSPFVTSDIKSTKEYGIAYAKKMLAGWMDGDSGLINSRQRRYHIAKLYSMGMQSENQYKNIVVNNKRVKTLNLIYKIQSVVPKYLKTLIEGFMELEESPKCTAIDPFSMQSKADFRMDAEMGVDHADFIGQMEGATGIKHLPDHARFESQEAVNLYMDMFFKLPKEIAFEQAVRFIDAENDERELKRQHLRNFAVWNKSVVKNTLNPDGTITRHIPNIERFVHSFSRKDNHTDVTYAGELLDMTISELRIRAAGELSEQEIYEIYCKSSKSSISTRFDQAWVNAYERWYDNHTVQVFQFEYLTVDKVVREKTTTKYGTMAVVHRRDSYKMDPAEGKELLSKDVQYRYSGYYVPCVQKVFKYGRDKMIERSFNMQKLSKCGLTYDIYEPDNYNGNSKSWVENIMAIADLMQVTWLRIQALIAKAKPAGLKIDIRGLEGVMKGKGGEVFTPLELIAIYEDTGNILYRSSTPDGKAYQGKPIEDAENRIGNQLTELIGVYNQCILQFQNNTGMNQATDGTLNAADASVTGSKILLSQSNRATRYIYEAYLNLKKRSTQRSVNQCQLSVMYKMNDGYWENALGMDAVDVIRGGNNPLELSDYGVEIEALPDDTKRQEIMMALQDAVNKGMISQKDKFVIEEIKNYKFAIKYLDYVENKRRQEAQQQAQQNSEMQAKIQDQTAQNAEKYKQETYKLQAQVEASKIDLKATADDHLLDKKFYQQLVIDGKLSLEEYENKFGINSNRNVNQMVAQGMSQPPEQQQEQPQAPPDQQQQPMDPSVAA